MRTEGFWLDLSLLGSYRAPWMDVVSSVENVVLAPSQVYQRPRRAV